MRPGPLGRSGRYPLWGRDSLGARPYGSTMLQTSGISRAQVEGWAPCVRYAASHHNSSFTHEGTHETHRGTGGADQHPARSLAQPCHFTGLLESSCHARSNSRAANSRVRRAMRADGFSVAERPRGMRWRVPIRGRVPPALTTSPAKATGRVIHWMSHCSFVMSSSLVCGGLGGRGFGGLAVGSLRSAHARFHGRAGDSGASPVPGDSSATMTRRLLLHQASNFCSKTSGAGVRVASKNSGAVSRSGASSGDRLGRNRAPGSDRCCSSHKRSIGDTSSLRNTICIPPGKGNARVISSRVLRGGLSAGRIGGLAVDALEADVKTAARIAHADQRQPCARSRVSRLAPKKVGDGRLATARRLRELRLRDAGIEQRSNEAWPVDWGHRAPRYRISDVMATRKTISNIRSL
jgi:hypothetical protein